MLLSKYYITDVFRFLLYNIKTVSNISTSIEQKQLHKLISIWLIESITRRVKSEGWLRSKGINWYHKILE